MRLDKTLMKIYWQKIKKWYWDNERYLSSFSLLAGFIFDSILLKRIDLFIENFWIIVHLLIACLGIIGLNIYEANSTRERAVPNWIYFWLIIVTQFAFGGLYSTFLIFYFRSATLITSWPFLLLLAANLIANEVLKYHYSRLSFQISVLYISIFSFTIFSVPILVHQIGPLVFLLSGLTSLLALGLFVWLLKWITRERFLKSRKLIWWSVGTIFVVINLLYFANLIPPIPLALKDSGVYHSITHSDNGNYLAKSEVETWRDFFRSYQPIHLVNNEPIYIYSTVFSPTSLNTQIVHEWQHYDVVKKDWVTNSQIKMPIIGGRDGGYRTYSYNTDLASGRWRVNVETSTGQLLGRIKFNVEKVNIEPTLVTKVLQ